MAPQSSKVVAKKSLRRRPPTYRLRTSNWRAKYLSCYQINPTSFSWSAAHVLMRCSAFFQKSFLNNWSTIDLNSRPSHSNQTDTTSHISCFPYLRQLNYTNVRIQIKTQHSTKKITIWFKQKNNKISAAHYNKTNTDNNESKPPTNNPTQSKQCLCVICSVGHLPS